MSLTDNSVVVITGAASGIGRALAIRLAREPIKGIVLADVNEAGLAETVAMIGDSGPEVTSHLVDVSDQAAMLDFADEVLERHGRVTHVINNAGVALGGDVHEVSMGDIDWLMGVNFWGVVFGTKIFLPHLMKERSAHIVNFSSLFGLIAPPGQAAYCASKFAVRGFTESLRHELEGTNVAVSVVHPGGVKTNIANTARIGEHTTQTKEQIEARRAKANKDLDRTSPEKAAEIIVKGIKARKSRIVIGPDARILGVIARLFPKRYFSVIDRLTGRRLRNE
ncbi:MAG: SDR family NAD(P)-dependent oxidoreductase [Acidobacteriota bacterium]|nr:MAG: SDR family NAD(P)-dependent oxidoreductase [Acidobacteriota bacterium]